MRQVGSLSFELGLGSVCMCDCGIFAVLAAVFEQNDSYLFFHPDWLSRLLFEVYHTFVVSLLRIKQTLGIL